MCQSWPGCDLSEGDPVTSGDLTPVSHTIPAFHPPGGPHPLLRHLYRSDAANALFQVLRHRSTLCPNVYRSLGLIQCPRIGKFGWEMTPYGYCFSTLSLQAHYGFSTLIH